MLHSSFLNYINKRFILIAAAAVIFQLLFAGCLRTYFPAVQSTSPRPLIYNHYDSSRIINKYITADLTIGRGQYRNESVQLLRGSYTLADTRNYFNINPQLYCYFGNYNVSGVPPYDGDKSIFGAGGEVSMAVNFKIESFKMGVGLTAGICAEAGGYYDFRKKAAGQGLIDDDPVKLVFFQFSAFPVVVYELSDTSILSMQANLGLPGIFSPGIVFNNNGYVYWLSWSPSGTDGKEEYGQRLVAGFMISLDNF